MRTRTGTVAAVASAGRESDTIAATTSAHRRITPSSGPFTVRVAEEHHRALVRLEHHRAAVVRGHVHRELGRLLAAKVQDERHRRHSWSEGRHRGREAVLADPGTDRGEPA